MKYVIPILLLVLLIGCTGRNDRPINQSAAISFLEDRGYEVLSYEAHAESYELTKQKIVTLPYMMYWGLQSVNPASYFGKTIDVEKFIVKSQGKVNVFVYVVDGTPIGGTSVPHEDASDGGYWSLDGKKLEEVQAKPFQEWQKDWLNEYGA
ncbi:hypothetical protein [Paenibacillus radicis (ex Gao et al. 2016)]|uniref:DUF4830 domain-containing protein n=1 Tax=Paenibacillus radicis (ex Gao et al. 2016) TaxID=1737354 RepID=A0A917M6P8_9BACL|nr:hypothetical protein [Paenibacillus radicis (ex Gao et al. 2016)]GGG81417.1 hypothetical protein GCM10010918_43330 [Paenibacillus radicis (ex Gao et al. 2016)]